MSLKKMSYKTATEIVDIYSSLLVKENPSFHAYGFSELQGYTILDVDNALKVIVAYDIFNMKKEEDLVRIRQYSKAAGGAVFSFFSKFVPDEVIPDIERLDQKDKSSILKFYDLVGNFEESPYYKAFSSQETHESFLNFCLNLQRSDENYWEKVYDRLSLVFDTKNTSDQIFIIVNNKSIFFKS